MCSRTQENNENKVEPIFWDTLLQGLYINFWCKPQIISNYILQFQLSSMHILEESSSGYLRFLKFIVKIACSM